MINAQKCGNLISKELDAAVSGAMLSASATHLGERTVIVGSKPVSCEIRHERDEPGLPRWCADPHSHTLTVSVFAMGIVGKDARPFINARLLTEFAANFLEELDGSNLNDCPHLAAPTMEAVARLAEERFVSFFARIGDVVALHAVSVSFADAGESILHLAVSNKISGPAGRN